ncbi:MAG: hypothetical protein PHE58_03105 [Candidatus Omnitrophica bacterium]|nr:hypothetical protein [Candidatus Omnitrophota bacterium]
MNVNSRAGNGIYNFLHMNRCVTFFLIVFYLAAGFFLLGPYRYEIDPDGISYISIAQKYMRGEIHDAVNACWGPLYSWLMVPFLMAGIDPLLASKILGVCIGAFSLYGFILLSAKFEIKAGIRNILRIAAIPILLNYALTLTTPDLLVVCIVMFYCTLVFDRGYPSSSMFSGILCGLAGAAGYLAKSYMLPFFIVHFSVMNAVWFAKEGTPGIKANIARTWMWGMCVCVLISGMWIGALSQKYGYVTFGTAGRYNFARTGPGMKGDTMLSMGHAMLHDGFLNMPNRTAINAFEDPSYFDRKFWNPVKNFHHYLSVLLINAQAAVAAFITFSPLSGAVLLFSLFIFVSGIQRRSPSGFLTGVLLMTAGIWTLGYMLVVVEERYLWINNFFLLCLAGISFGEMGRYWPRAVYKSIIAVTVISFLFAPVKNLIMRYNCGRDIRELSEQLKMSGVRGAFASSTHWYLNYYLAYHLQSRYYGVSNNLYDCDRLKNELEKRHCDYFFAWDDSDEAGCFFLKDKTVFSRGIILEGVKHTVTVYKTGNWKE